MPPLPPAENHFSFSLCYLFSSGSALQRSSLTTAERQGDEIGGEEPSRLRGKARKCRWRRKVAPGCAGFEARPAHLDSISGEPE